MATTILNASVYVGTYRKYNNGSIEGAWIKLSDYKTKRDFISACKELHKDESDPELMYQDYDSVPSSMISESNINDELWHVINSLKKYNIDKADEFADWCEDNGAEQDYSALIEFLGWNKTKVKKQNVDMSTSDMESLINKYISDKWYINYYKERMSYVWEIENGIVLFEKPCITTEFCFDDENESALYNYHHFDERYFMSKNLKKLDVDIDEATEALKVYDNSLAKFYLVKRLNIYEVVFADRDRYDECIEMNPEQVKKYISILIHERDKFKKRLKSYLKRYGLTKIHKWTYWANE